MIKKVILAIFVSLMMGSPVYADEEIQLAAVMIDSDSSPIETNKKTYAALGGSGSGASAGGVSGTAIITGIVVAATLVIASDGFDSTSNH